MGKALNMFRWFILGFGLAYFTEDLVSAIILIIYIVLNFEERDWSKRG